MEDYCLVLHSLIIGVVPWWGHSTFGKLVMMSFCTRKMVKSETKSNYFYAFCRTLFNINLLELRKSYLPIRKIWLCKSFIFISICYHLVPAWEVTTIKAIVLYNKITYYIWFVLAMRLSFFTMPTFRAHPWKYKNIVWRETFILIIRCKMHWVKQFCLLSFALC